MMKRYCFTIDLVDDENKILEYEGHHQRVWPEVEASFKRAGIETLELYRTGNRLFMLFDTDESFSLEDKAQIDATDPVVVKWEKLMSSYQQAIPGSTNKWTILEKIYSFSKPG